MFVPGLRDEWGGLRGTGEMPPPGLIDAVPSEPVIGIPCIGCLIYNREKTLNINIITIIICVRRQITAEC